jgi:phosphonate transport system substrate-binding protein
MKQIKLLLLAILFSTLPLKTALAEEDTIVFGIISTESSQALKKEWEQFLEDMEEALEMRVEAFFAPDYGGVIEGMRFGKVDIARLGNKSAIEAVDRSGAEVFAQLINKSGYPGYHSLLIVHEDSEIKSIEDIINSPGKYTLGNGDPNSTSGFLIPSYYVFARHNIDPKKHFKRVTNSNHSFNALAVANKQVDIATNNTTNIGDPDKGGVKDGKLWETYPKKAEQIRVIWKSPLIPSSPLVYRT